jgi:uncharacterized membrane protein
VTPAEPDELQPVERSDAAWMVLLAVAVVYTFVTARLALRNHDGFGTLGYDLGNFDQGVWLLSRFERPFITIMGRNLFGDHTSFILLPFVPVYWLVPSAKALLVAQSYALGFSAIPVYLIARDTLRHELLAAGVALAFLAHPVLGWTNFDQFHPDAFEIPLVLFAFWFMLRRRWTAFLVCVGAVLLVKEDVPLLTFVLGVYVAVRHHRRVGLVVSAVSAAYFVVMLGLVKPGLGVPGSFQVGRIPFGGYGGLLRTTFTRPWDLGAYLLDDGRPWYTWQLVAPFGLLPVFEPRLLLVGLGPFAFNVVSTFVYQHRIQYHYATLLLPVLVVAAVFAIARARRFRVRAILVAAMVATSLVSSYLWGALPGAPAPARLGDPASALARDARAAIARIPPDASVSAQYPFTTHLTHRREIYEFPNPFHAHWWALRQQEGQRLPQAGGVAYVILTKDRGYWTPELDAVLRSLEGEFETVSDSETVLLLRRRAQPAP